MKEMWEWTRSQYKIIIQEQENECLFEWKLLYFHNLPITQDMLRCHYMLHYTSGVARVMAECGFRHTKAAIDLQLLVRSIKKLKLTSTVSLMHLLPYDHGRMQL